MVFNFLVQVVIQTHLSSLTDSHNGNTPQPANTSYIKYSPWLGLVRPMIVAYITNSLMVNLTDWSTLGWSRWPSRDGNACELCMFVPCVNRTFWIRIQKLTLSGQSINNWASFCICIPWTSVPGYHDCLSPLPVVLEHAVKNLYRDTP